MKTVKRLKVTLLILLIILISLVSFGGIWVQSKGRMNNLINDYILGRDLKGGRYITLELIENESDGEEDKKEKTEETAEDKTEKEDNKKENFIKAKKIIENRLEEMKVEDYVVALNEKTGQMNIQLPENDNTDYYIEYCTMNGKFTIENEKGEVLLDNSRVKEAKTMYGQVSTGSGQGIKVFLRVYFNDEGTEKINEISKEYITSTDKDGNDTSKKVKIKLDDTTLSETSFEKEITDGHIELGLGDATTSSDEIQYYLQQGSYIEKIIDNGNLPYEYELTRNYYIMSDITLDIQIAAVLVFVAIILIIVICLTAKYKKIGLIVSLTSIGFIAMLLFIIRYTNVVITIDSVVGIMVAILINYIFEMYLIKYLNSLDDSKTEIESNINKGIIKGIWALAPISIIAIILCFSKWLLINSIGMILFWGIIMMIIYNLVITKNLLMNLRKE